jgi:hypothetical protein
VITSQLATDAAVGAATQVPPEQICPLLQSELLPQPGATQVPSSQTWPELQSAAVKQLCALSAPAGVAPAAMSPQQKAAASAFRLIMSFIPFGSRSKNIDRKRFFFMCHADRR